MYLIFSILAANILPVKYNYKFFNLDRNLIPSLNSLIFSTFNPRSLVYKFKTKYYRLNLDLTEENK